VKYFAMGSRYSSVFAHITKCGFSDSVDDGGALIASTADSPDPDPLSVDNDLSAEILIGWVLTVELLLFFRSFVVCNSPTNGLSRFGSGLSGKFPYSYLALSFTCLKRNKAASHKLDIR
jgi:hypothetical protein